MRSSAIGRIESFPADLVGAWVVGGVTYNADGSSEFKQEDGAFAVGACVKIHALTTTTPATIREVRTERDYRCGGTAGRRDGGAAGEGEIYGVLQSFPANLIGEWNVAGMTYVADTGTEFVQANGAFAVGVTVKVHFSTDAAGVNRAREIETKYANDSGGSDDDGNGSYEGAEGHAYGIADSVPSGLVGAWSIGGVSYTATADTKFEQTDGALVNGARVKVEYYLGAGGERIAKKIESTTENGGATAPDNFKVFGFVDQMPSGGLVGTWIVDNVTYVAGAGAKFDETNAVLGIGAYVGVEYSVQNGEKQVHEIEAHVPPGAGPQTFLGTIDDKGGSMAQAVAGRSGHDLGHRRRQLQRDSRHQFQRFLWQPECGCYGGRQQLQGGGRYTRRHPDSRPDAHDSPLFAGSAAITATPTQSLQTGGVIG